jgi:hypothetical protein
LNTIHKIDRHATQLPEPLYHRIALEQETVPSLTFHFLFFHSHSLINLVSTDIMAALLAGSVLALATAAYAAPLIITGTDIPATTIQAAGGGPLLPGTISANAIGAFQVANFLENLV